MRVRYKTLEASANGLHDNDMSSAHVSALSCTGTTAVARLQCFRPFTPIAPSPLRLKCRTPFRSSTPDHIRCASVNAASLGSNMLQGLKRSFTKVCLSSPCGGFHSPTVLATPVHTLAVECRSPKSLCSKATPLHSQTTQIHGKICSTASDRNSKSLNGHHQTWRMYVHDLRAPVSVRHSSIERHCKSPLQLPFRDQQTLVLSTELSASLVALSSNCTGVFCCTPALVTLLNRNISCSTCSEKACCV